MQSVTTLQISKPGSQNGKGNATPPRMVLANISKGRVENPPRMVVYGVEGVGKSTFAAGAPNPIFLCAESGTDQLDLHRFPEPRSWSELLDAVRVLTLENHGYKTLVLDTVDWAEPLCWEHVAHEEGWRNIETPGFGKGYSAALDQWRVLLARLGELRQMRRMNIVLLGHSAVRSFRNPEGPDYDRFAPKLQEKAAALVKEWADFVLFARYEMFGGVGGEPDKEGRGTLGARILHTQWSPAFDAKNRADLPAQIPLAWESFELAARARVPKSAERLRGEFENLLPKLPVERQAAARSAVARASGNCAKLAKIVDHARGLVMTGKVRDFKPGGPGYPSEPSM